MNTKRIVIAGGAGFCGRLLTDYLLAKDWQVVALTRSLAPSNGRARSVLWDAKTVGEWARELEGADAVVNFCGRSVNCRYNAANRKLILDSRVHSTRVLGEAIGRCANPPRTWLNASTATIYKHSYDLEMDENGSIAGDKDAKDEFSVEVAQAWEAALAEAKTPATRKIPMRMSMVFSPEKKTVYQVLRNLARRGLGGKMASGRQYVAWIHERDFCRAVEWLLEHEILTGPFNLAAPSPVTNAHLMAAFREAVGVQFGLPAAGWMMEIGAFFLRTETELMLKSRRVVPRRLLESGFVFDYPRIEQALAEIEQRLKGG